MPANNKILAFICAHVCLYAHGLLLFSFSFPLWGHALTVARPQVIVKVYGGKYFLSRG